MLLAIPGADACQIDVLPAQRREVLEQTIRNLATHVAQVGDGPLAVFQCTIALTTRFKARCAKRLAFERSVTDFTTLVEENNPLQLMRELTPC